VHHLTANENPVLMGHDALLKTVSQAQALGRLPHGWLLWGPRGVGKRTAAYALARQLLSGGRTLLPEDPLFRRIASETHGDFWILRGGLVEHVRELNQFLQKAPVEGDVQVAILPHVDEMTPSAANALLKTLEEPLGHTVFILTAEKRGRILPTILSRCRVVRLNPLERQDFPEALARFCSVQGLPPLAGEETEGLWDLTRGCLGQAITLMGEGKSGQAVALHRLWDSALLLDWDKTQSHPFHPRHLPTWKAFPFSWLAEAFMLWLQGILIQCGRGEGTGAHQTVYGMRTPVAWGEVVSRVQGLLNQAAVFHLDPMATFVSIWSLIALRSSSQGRRP